MKKFTVFAIVMMLMVSCIGAKAPKNEVVQSEGDVFSNAYDGFVSIRMAPSARSMKIGELKNGPKGATLIEYNSKWSKIEYQGIQGYVYNEYLQTTPTEPVSLRPEDVVGSWYYRPEGWGHTCIIINDDGTYHIYNENFCEGAITSDGTWRLVGDDIEFNERYDYVVGLVWGGAGIKSNKKQLLKVDVRRNRLMYEGESEVAYNRE